MTPLAPGRHRRVPVTLVGEDLSRNLRLSIGLVRDQCHMSSALQARVRLRTAESRPNGAGPVHAMTDPYHDAATQRGEHRNGRTPAGLIKPRLGRGPMLGRKGPNGCHHRHRARRDRRPTRSNNRLGHSAVDRYRDRQHPAVSNLLRGRKGPIPHGLIRCLHQAGQVRPLSPVRPATSALRHE
jgi:hypothetical protein